MLGDLVGRWLLDQPTGTGTAELVLRESGAWTGSDGCNGVGGRFVLGPRGRLLALAGASTAVGCDHVPLAQLMAQAARVAVIRGRLVLYGERGDPLIRLAPAPVR